LEQLVRASGELLGTPQRVTELVETIQEAIAGVSERLHEEEVGTEVDAPELATRLPGDLLQLGEQGEPLGARRGRCLEQR
jgi:hypothetical protein